jgi:hypothetical protein
MFTFPYAIGRENGAPNAFGGGHFVDSLALHRILAEAFHGADKWVQIRVAKNKWGELRSWLIAGESVRFCKRSIEEM